MLLVTPLKMFKPRNKASAGIPNCHSISDLTRGHTDEILGKVIHHREVITLTRYGKPVARIVPIEDALVTDPTAKFSPVPPKKEKP